MMPTIQAAKIPHSRPWLGREEQEAVRRVLATGMLAQGPEVEAFEIELGAVVGLPRCVAVAHGTAALHLALLGLGACPGQDVLLPAYSCVSLLNAVLYTGARPVLVDCEPGGSGVCPDSIRESMTRDVCAVLVTHMFGQPAAMDRLGGLPVVEDCTHALGARLGSGGRASVYSFYPTKLLAGGEGGALLTRDPALEVHARDRRSYDQRARFELRYNYKMTDMAAALLRVQLSRLGAFLERRAAIASLYRREFAGLDVSLPPAGGIDYRFVVRIEGRELDAVVDALHQRDVGACRPVFKPLHHYLEEHPERYPHAEKAYRTNLSIPLYPALQDEEIERIVTAVREVLR